MKNFLLTIFVSLTLVGLSFGQTTLVDFETVADPLVEPFDITSYTSAVANPDGTGSVGKVVKDGSKSWGGINVYFGGDVQFTGTNDTLSIDFYTTDAGNNDTIYFTLQLFQRGGGSTTIQVDAYYVDAVTTTTGVWRTLKFAIPDGTTGIYNQMVIFFGWSNSNDGDTYYFDNVVAPGFTAYTSTDVTFNITDKFNNATDVQLFIEGTEATLTQTDNVYSNTTSLDPYTVLVGESVGIYEVVYSHMANGVEVRDTTSFVCGNTTGSQELLQLIIVEAPEDGTALAISVGTTPPTIDGTVDAVWANAKTHTHQERSWWGSPTGLYSSWKIMWDIDNVYLLYIVEDATPYNANANNYENDCVETFFDMNQSAGTPFDADDYQIRTIRGLDTWTGSVDATWGADVSRAQDTTDEGYTIEMAIPWSSLSASLLPLAGTEFNYDGCVADVGASGGARLYRESWTTNSDIAYLNTVDYGTITLSALTNEGSTAIRNTEVSNLSVYPNPANNQLTISSELELSSISIVDITGRVVNSISSINSNYTVLNVNNLTEGIYIVKVTDVEGNSSSQKIRVY
jgi:hypothetical protein